jgi:hypothetical protein
LGLVNLQKSNFRTAFDFVVSAFKNEKQVDETVYQKALQMALESAKSLVK